MKNGTQTHRHVALAANICLGNACHELAADAKVAELDEAVAVDEDVGGLDVSVYHREIIFEELEGLDRAGYSALRSGRNDNIRAEQCMYHDVDRLLFNSLRATLGQYRMGHCG